MHPTPSDCIERILGAAVKERLSPRLERNLLYRLDGLGGTAPALEL